MTGTGLEFWIEGLGIVRHPFKTRLKGTLTWRRTQMKTREERSGLFIELSVSALGSTARDPAKPENLQSLKLLSPPLAVSL